MVATLVLLLLHVPPEVDDASVDVFPSHSVVAPVIAPGSPSTVIYLDDTQPVVAVLYMVVPPPASALITPVVLFTVPTLVLLLLQVPPPGVAVTVCVVPLHIDVVAVTVGVEFTVTSLVT